MSSPRVITDLGGTVACAWCGLQVPLASFEGHSAQCERAVRSGQRSMFGGARGLFDDVEPPAKDEPATLGLAEAVRSEGVAFLARLGGPR